MTSVKTITPCPYVDTFLLQ